MMRPKTRRASPPTEETVAGETLNFTASFSVSTLNKDGFFFFAASNKVFRRRVLARPMEVTGAPVLSFDRVSKEIYRGVA